MKSSENFCSGYFQWLYPALCCNIFWSKVIRYDAIIFPMNIFKIAVVKNDSEPYKT